MPNSNTSTWMKRCAVAWMLRDRSMQSNNTL